MDAVRCCRCSGRVDPVTYFGMSDGTRMCDACGWDAIETMARCEDDAAPVHRALRFSRPTWPYGDGGSVI